MAKNIDLNRGVNQRKHKGLGAYVYMYIDTPGVFLNEFGKEVPEELAAQAGFDVKLLGKQKQRKALLSAAEAAIETELALAGVKPRSVLETRDGYSIVDAALGNAWLEDPDGEKLTPRPIPLAQAKLMLDVFAPEKSKPKPGKEA